MDRSLRQDNHRHRHRRSENPSFSSTLLDAIYRSIDEGNGGDHHRPHIHHHHHRQSAVEGELIFYRETMRKKQSGSVNGGLKEEEGMVNFRKACMVEKWMEKKVNEKVIVRRSSVADFDRKSRQHLLNSSSSSSESSCGGGFSSSESTESFRGSKSRSSSCYSMQRPKPIRTSVSAPATTTSFENNKTTHQFDGYSANYDQYGLAPKQKPKHENGFVKTKSKALKIYGDLKKVKQPISPGGRLASFLNSLFTAGGNTKKPKIDDLGSQRKSKSTNGSTCSSASSLSRSCLSNTPSSRGKFGGGAKRSVRFCPVSVIVDEDCRPCGHKSLHEDHREPAALLALTAATNINVNVEQLGYYVVDDDRRRVQEVAIDLLKSYQKKNLNDNGNNVVVNEFDMRDVVHNNDDINIGESDDDDDAASYSSSDLFELDNLSAIGIERYSEELPVYETTHFDTNRAIANGLIL